MEYCYYELKQSPDFSLSKYSSLSETGSSGVITQHMAFWRQLNQWGKLFNGCIHLIYQYDANKEAGTRMNMVIRFDAPTTDGINSARQIMKSSVLQPYYDFLRETDRSCISDKKYIYLVNLKKREYFVSSANNPDVKYYTVSKWEMNKDARLYSMLRLMNASEVSSAYCVDIYPTDYEETLENALQYILPHLRNLNSFKVNKTESSVSTSGKDDSAKKALDFYETLIDDINSSPHFLANIQVFSDGNFVAQQIVDASASEALSKGTYILCPENYGGTVENMINSGLGIFSDENAPENMLELPHLFTLEQISPFAMMPVLFPGEEIEMPKETVPKQESGMLIGTDTQNHNISVPWKNLSKHCFMAGMPGSGKTNTMMYLISRIFEHNIPVLILEPAKKEYRSLLSQPNMKNVSLFSPCANSMYPLHINPFRFPKGMKLADHINRLLDVFNGTFQLDAPMPMLLTEGIQLVYEELGWLPGMINEGKLPYPTMSKLYIQIEKLFDKYKYAEEVRSNLQSVLQVRIGSLLAREMGDIFDVENSTFAEEEWLEKSAIIELASLGTAPSNFLMLLLMTLIRETLDVTAYDPEKYGNAPRHAIFLEEAHNLIADRSVQEAGAIDPKISATAFIVKMLAEVRSLGEAIVIADQLPTAMAAEVVKNTSLKFGLRLTAQDERELLGSSISADALQLEKMGTLTPGRCFVSYEGLLKPFEMQVPEFKGDDILTDSNLKELLFIRPAYLNNMMRSAEIMKSKFRKRKEALNLRQNQLIDDMKDYLQNKKNILAKLEDFKDGDVLNPERKEILNMAEINHKNIIKSIDELMADWYRLQADIGIYMTIGLDIKKHLAEHKNLYISDEYNTAIAMTEKWCAIINEEYSQTKMGWESLLFLVDRFKFNFTDTHRNIYLLRNELIFKD